MKIEKIALNVNSPALIFAAGFYAGYKETTGFDLSSSVEFLTKYAPTMFTLIMSSEIPNLFSKLSKLSRKGIQDDTLTFSDKKYSQANPKDQFKASTTVHKLERTSEQLQENKLQKTFYRTVFTGTTTLLGYWAGSAFAQTNF